MRAPFPYYGSKYEAAPLIEALMGPIKNLVLPFAGSLGELLGRSEPATVETANDADGLLVNAWRSITYSPERVGELVDHPVHEATLHAAQHLLVTSADSLIDLLRSDPTAHDPALAAWWIWGKSCWLGGGWCRTTRAGTLTSEGKRPALAGQGDRPHLGYGVARPQGKRPQLSGRQNRPHFGNGVTRPMPPKGQRRPQLSPGGSGVVVRPEGHQKLPSLQGRQLGSGVCIRGSAPNLSGGAGRPAKGSGVHARQNRERLVSLMQEIADRLRWVRITCGDWERVLTPAVTTSHGVTGVSLDPPYSMDVRKPALYRHDERGVAEAARAWAVANGDDPLLRIVLAGKEEEHSELEALGWTKHVWRPRDGETLWASPYCVQIHAQQGELFAMQAELR